MTCPYLNQECDSDSPNCQNCTLQIQLQTKCNRNHSGLGSCSVCGYCGDHISLSKNGYCYNCGKKVT